MIAAIEQAEVAPRESFLSYASSMLFGFIQSQRSDDANATTSTSSIIQPSTGSAPATLPDTGEDKLVSQHRVKLD